MTTKAPAGSVTIRSVAIPITTNISVIRVKVSSSVPAKTPIWSTFLIKKAEFFCKKNE